MHIFTISGLPLRGERLAALEKDIKALIKRKYPEASLSIQRGGVEVHSLLGRLEYENACSYEGPFEIHLVSRSLTDAVAHMPGVTHHDSVVRVGFNQNQSGKVAWSDRGICFFSGPQLFTWRRDLIKKVVDANGNILWQNAHHSGG